MDGDSRLLKPHMLDFFPSHKTSPQHFPFCRLGVSIFILFFNKLFAALQQWLAVPFYTKCWHFIRSLNVFLFYRGFFFVSPPRCVMVKPWERWRKLTTKVVPVTRLDDLPFMHILRFVLWESGLFRTMASNVRAVSLNWWISEFQQSMNGRLTKT